MSVFTYEGKVPPSAPPEPPAIVAALWCAITSVTGKVERIEVTAEEDAALHAWFVAVRSASSPAAERYRPLIRGAWPIVVGKETRVWTEGGAVGVHPKPAFTPFWWESGPCWGEVRNLDNWRGMIADTLGGSAADLLDRGRAIRPPLSGELVSVGVKPEHRNGQPFREWAREHGMEEVLSLKKEQLVAPTEAPSMVRVDASQGENGAITVDRVTVMKTQTTLLSPGGLRDAGVFVIRVNSDHAPPIATDSGDVVSSLPLTTGEVEIEDPDTTLVPVSEYTVGIDHGDGPDHASAVLVRKNEDGAVDVIGPFALGEEPKDDISNVMKRSFSEEPEWKNEYADPAAALPEGLRNPPSPRRRKK